MTPKNISKPRRINKNWWLNKLHLGKLLNKEVWTHIGCFFHIDPCSTGVSKLRPVTQSWPTNWFYGTRHIIEVSAACFIVRVWLHCSSLASTSPDVAAAPWLSLYCNYASVSQNAFSFFTVAAIFFKDRTLFAKHRHLLATKQLNTSCQCCYVMHTWFNPPVPYTVTTIFSKM